MSYEKHVIRLLDDAEDLVRTLRDSDDPNIQRLRDRVDALVVAAKGANEAKQGKSDRRAPRSMRITRLPGSLIEYVNQHPFLAVITAASLAWTLSNLSSAARFTAAARR